MGYIIKVSRNKQILSILNSSETRCSFGLDNRGIPELTSWDAPKFLTLINLEQKEPHVIDLIVYASELMNNIDQALIEGSTHSFPRYIKIKWRDMQFEIISISSCAFVLAKLGQSELLKRRPRYQLECNSINLSVPIFPGTTLTIGSHSSDSILVSEKDIKPKHVQLKLLEDSSELGINALLGQVESRVELGTSVFRLIPSQIEFVIKALGQ